MQVNRLLWQCLPFYVQGQKVAFVGESGSGKSTIMALLERFYDPIAGAVLVNNQDLRRAKRKNYEIAFDILIGSDSNNDFIVTKGTTNLPCKTFRDDVIASQHVPARPSTSHGRNLNIQSYRKQIGYVGQARPRSHAKARLCQKSTSFHWIHLPVYVMYMYAYFPRSRFSSPPASDRISCRDAVEPQRRTLRCLNFMFAEIGASNVDASKNLKVILHGKFVFCGVYFQSTPTLSC